jgi:hypothetical protein
MFSLAVNRPHPRTIPLPEALHRVAPRIRAAARRGIPRAAIVACIYEYLVFGDRDPALTHATISRFVDALLDGVGA